MGDVVVHFRSQDRVDDPSGAAFRQRFRSRSHDRYSMNTFLSLVPAGTGGCSSPSRFRQHDGVVSEVEGRSRRASPKPDASYGGLGFPGKLGFRNTGGGGGVGGG